MSSSLSSEHLSQLVPLLGSLARLLADGSQLNENELHVLLLGASLEDNLAAMDEISRWGRLLKALQQASSDTQRRATIEALRLRGLPEATVLLAVATVVGSGIGAAQTTTVSASPGSARLQASVTNLDFGILRPSQGATLEFEVQGGPGQVSVESDQIQVTPTQFGVGPTRLRVELRPLMIGLLWTTLKLVTVGETLEVPVTAQWQDGDTAPAKLLLNPMIPSAPPAPPTPLHVPRQPRPIPRVPATEVVQPVRQTTTPMLVLPIPSGSPALTRQFYVWICLLALFVVVVGGGLLNQNRSVPAAAPTTALVIPTVVPTTAPVISTPLPAWVPELVEVPDGPLLMGSTDQQIADAVSQGADASWIANEKPQHSVTMPTYWIGKTEVTNTQFRPFVEGDGYTNQTYWDAAGWQWRTENKVNQPGCWSDSQWNSANQPVACVTWYEAMAYTHWVSVQTSQRFSLPTEAEWEKAARGTDGRIYPWGNTWEVNLANSNESGIGKTTPVGQYPRGASPYGALDMAGNAWEWTRSIYTPYPYNPTDGREDGSNPAQKGFTLRGGAWSNLPINLRASSRVIRTPDYHDPYVGFRIAQHSQQ